MKKCLLTATALSIIGSAALAADLPSYKAPVAPPPPPPMWTGFHIGVNAGGTWSNGGGASRSVVPVSPVPRVPGSTATLAGGFTSGNSTGFIGGGQVGYDWQLPVRELGLVAGLEADIQGIAASGGGGSSSSVFFGRLAGDVGVTDISGSSSLNYLGTVRGRIGYLVMPELMVYGTGGLAYGDVSTNFNAYQVFNSRLFRTWIYQAFGGGSQSDIQVGYTAGGGVEWMFMPNWSAKAEYLYYDLGNASANANIIRLPNPRVNADPPSLQAVSSANARAAGNIVRAGVNYHLNWISTPVVAAY